jgi:protein gp37
MAEHSHIEWTDATWNPITGCSVVSPGCANCYAMRLAGGRLKHHPSRAGLFKQFTARETWLRIAAHQELRGKDLACWCPLDQPCHADVLLELANRDGGAA